MAMTTLICPHCGGIFDLDDERTLQPFWVCPYCGNRSLMQKTGGTIRLRGIIGSKSAPAAVDLSPGPTDTEPEAGEPGPDLGQPEPLTDMSAESGNEPEPSQPVTPPESRPEAAATAEPAGKADAPAAEPVPDNKTCSPDRYYLLAKEAADQHDLPHFNTYSRLALDIRPTDARVYALRAVLFEEAGGFARMTWASPPWVLLSPLTKQAAMTQQLYNFNTAIKYFSSFEQRQELTQGIARLLVRQLIDQFTEQAEIRCRRRLFNKQFKGRYRRADLASAENFINAMSLLDERVSPLGHLDLLAAIRVEIQNLPPRLARSLKKV